MQAVERNLYSRNGFYYFRSSLPRYLHPLLPFKEIRIGLDTQDLSEARVVAAKLGYEFNKRLWEFQNGLKELSPEQSPESVIDSFLHHTDELKRSVGYKPTVTFSYTGKKNKAPQKLLFSEIVKKYWEDCPSNTLATRFQKDSVYTLFTELVGDLPFQDIGLEEGRLFKTRLLKIPPNAKKILNITSFKNVDLDKLNTGKTQHPVTINNRLKYLIALFSWAERAGFYQGKNPFSHLTIKLHKVSSSRRHPYKPEELKTVFLCPVFKGSRGKQWTERLQKGDTIYQDSLLWVPLIGLYSGMRLNEICQLYVTDIRQEDGIYIFDVNDDGDDKLLKTSSSHRKVPIHKELIRRGLLDYVAQRQKEGELRLFPDLPRGATTRTYSSTFTKRFWRLLRALGVKRQGLCFHSLRHTFIDGLRNTGVERSIVMTLTGHQGSKDVHDSYGYGYNLSILKEGINKLSFPALEK